MRTFFSGLLAVAVLFSFMSISTGCTEDPVSAGVDTLYITGAGQTQFVIPVTISPENCPSFTRDSIGMMIPSLVSFGGTVTVTWADPVTSNDWYRIIVPSPVASGCSFSVDGFTFSPTSASFIFSSQVYLENGLTESLIHPYSGNLKVLLVMLKPTAQ